MYSTCCTPQSGTQDKQRTVFHFSEVVLVYHCQWSNYGTLPWSDTNKLDFTNITAECFKCISITLWPLEIADSHQYLWNGIDAEEGPGRQSCPPGPVPHRPSGLLHGVGGAGGLTLLVLICVVCRGQRPRAILGHPWSQSNTCCVESKKTHRHKDLWCWCMLLFSTAWISV